MIRNLKHELELMNIIKLNYILINDKFSYSFALKKYFKKSIISMVFVSQTPQICNQRNRNSINYIVISLKFNIKCLWNGEILCH